MVSPLFAVDNMFTTSMMERNIAAKLQSLSKVPLINHCCIAHSHNDWNEEAEQDNIHLIRDIETGEKMTIS